MNLQIYYKCFPDCFSVVLIQNGNNYFGSVIKWEFTKMFWTFIHSSFSLSMTFLMWGCTGRDEFGLGVHVKRLDNTALNRAAWMTENTARNLHLFRTVFTSNVVAGHAFKTPRHHFISLA